MRFSHSIVMGKNMKSRIDADGALQVFEQRARDSSQVETKPQTHKYVPAILPMNNSHNQWN